MGETYMHEHACYMTLHGDQGTFEAKSSSLRSSCFFFRALTGMDGMDGKGSCGIPLVTPQEIDQ